MLRVPNGTAMFVRDVFVFWVDRIVTVVWWLCRILKR
jgi:hypothetical protein